MVTGVGKCLMSIQFSFVPYEIKSVKGTVLIKGGPQRMVGWDNSPMILLAT